MPTLKRKVLGKRFCCDFGIKMWCCAVCDDLLSYFPTQLMFLRALYCSINFFDFYSTQWPGFCLVYKVLMLNNFTFKPIPSGFHVTSLCFTETSTSETSNLLFSFDMDYPCNPFLVQRVLDGFIITTSSVWGLKNN